MRNLVVCADGTWNTPDDKDGGLPAPTNVVKLFNAVAEPGTKTPQLRYYHPGVGTDGSKIDRLLGGGIGKGLDENIMSGYKWLATHYQPNDRIFVFGFSRGAYTVRSLGGMISRCGLLNLTDAGMPDSDIWKQVQQAFACYRARSDVAKALKGLKFHNGVDSAKAPKSTPVHFIGVWDTVGALGVPDDLGLLDLVDDPKNHEFHDTDLSDNVQVARHAVAMDEMRQSFAPTLWTGYPKSQDVKQIWFPGVHGDVGGGYSRTGLSDGALLWMLEEARKAGLEFRAGVKAQIKPDFLDVLHDSRTGIFSALKTEPRQVPQMRKGGRDFDTSAADRHANPPLSQAKFWTTKALAPGEAASLRVFARERWNVTDLFLEAGVTYRFAASGEWLDGSVACGPKGTKDGDFHVAEVAHVAASALGKLEGFFKKITDNPKADFWTTKRVENENWFALIGVVANGAVNIGKKNPADNELFAIGAGRDFKPALSGYLYCFANDAWHAYDNNKGSVGLTVTRLP